MKETAKQNDNKSRRGRQPGVPISAAKLQIMAEKYLAPYAKRLLVVSRTMQSNKVDAITVHGLASATKGIDWISTFVAGAETAIVQATTKSARSLMDDADLSDLANRS